MRKIIVAVGLCAFAFAAHATVSFPDEINVRDVAMKKVGQGTLSYLLVDPYDAAFWSADGSANLNQPHAVEIHYRMGFSSEDLAERSVEEMNRIKDFPADLDAKWQQEMQRIFPDVKKGDRIRAAAFPEKKVVFFHNGKPTGEVTDPEFSRAFTAIWVGANTSEPELRAKLLGQ